MKTVEVNRRSQKAAAGVNDLTEFVAFLAVHCRGSSAEEKVNEALEIIAEVQRRQAGGASRGSPTTLQPADDDAE